ncbi:MAG: glycosyltransferase family 4 protein [Limisphaerales bacterium]
MHFSIIASSPSLELSGANVLVANLLDRLQQGGRPSEWIVTGHNPTEDAAWLGTRQFKLHRLPPTGISEVRRRQKLLCHFLEERSPCVYLPNFDFDMACAIPALPAENKSVLIMHCDDPVYHDFVAEHGNLFNAIVCVSKFLAEKLRGAHPDLKERIVHIPFGVEPPGKLPDRNRSPGQPLEVAYCGRISFHQKRVEDLAAIINRCHDESVPVKFHIAGTGPDEKEFFSRIREPLAAEKVSRAGFLPNAEVLQLLAQSDVLLMTSDFEGLPVVLLEAMSRGCVPVATKIESGMGELVEHGENGFLLPVGDVAGFVATLKKLATGPEQLRPLRQAAFERIGQGGFTLERAAGEYRSLFESLIYDDSKWGAPRTGQMLFPAHYTFAARLKRKIKQLFNDSSQVSEQN